MSASCIEAMQSLRIQPQDGLKPSTSRTTKEKTNSSRYLNDAIIHMFLPKRTPGSLQPDLEDIEEFLLHTFCNSIAKVCEQGSCSQLEATLAMFEKWIQLQPKSGADNFHYVQQFQQQVSAIACGETLPIYVRKQNSTLLISKLIDSSIKMATFRSSLPSKIVMSTVGSLVFNFPETEEIIHNTELLGSQAFASLLYELATRDLELSQGKTPKGGQEFTETRDVVDPFLVSDWCMALLVPGSIKSSNLPQHQLKKKIRDQINLSDSRGSAKLLPFRRSGMYMSLKASLQLKLIDAFGSTNQANLIYKILLLQILTDISEQFYEWNEASRKIDTDLISQMLSKLAKRAFKLENMAWDLSLAQNEELSIVVKTLKTRCLKNTETVVERLRATMYEVWNYIAKPFDFANLNAGPKESSHVAGHNEVLYERDLHHRLPLLDRFIDKLKTVATTSSPRTFKENISTADSQAFQRYPNVHSIENSTISSNVGNIWLYDTENIIKYQCGGLSASRIFSLMTKYVENARKLYNGNPLGMSQLLLVTLKAVELVDKVVTKTYPLLLEYKPGVNLEVFDNLLLPYLKDMDILEESLGYFRNRDGRATFSGILNDATVTADTFSVRFAAQNDHMMQLRETILQDTETSVRRKYEEVDSMRQTCELLQQQITAEGYCKCEYTINTWVTRWGHTRSKRVKVSTCLKCTLEPRLRAHRNSISYFEKPLPPHEIYQNSVVFELLVPEKFAVWRDCMAFFKFTVLGEPIFHEVNNSLSQKWLEYGNISPFKGTSLRTNMCLGSTVMPASSTYHTATRNLDVLNNRNENFVVNNGMNCTFHYDAIQSPLNCSNTTFAFQLSTTSNNAPYKNLQDTLVSTTLTQNNILARQYGCHQKLALHEFVAFGSLRGGHRIQLRNLYEAIFSGKLSLEQEPVLALVLQTIWQVGPRDRANIRESHIDFQDTVFAQEFLDMLDKIVKTNEANYSNSLILLIAVTITTRIADLNASMKENCYNVLSSWRNIMTTWITKIQAALDKSETASVCDGIASLRKNLLEVLLCSLFSFSIADQSSLDSVIKSENDVMHWLQSLYQLHQLDELPLQKSEFLKLLLDNAKLLPLRVAVESKILENNPLFLNPVKSFIREQWNKAKECTIRQLAFPLADKHKGHILLAEYLEMDMETGEGIHHHVTFDFYKGTFLVNGFSQTSLPTKIRDNKLFTRFFNKDGTILRVQKDTPQVTRTVTKYRQRHYEFFEATVVDSRYLRIELSSGNEDQVIIKEINDDSSKLVLLDPSKFSNSLSEYFITNYTHWLDSTKSIVYFRPANGDHEYSHDYQLEKDGTTSVWKLIDVRSHEFVLSIESQNFENITKRLRRLEKSCYINITLSPSTLVVTAHLRRYNLRFTTTTSNTASLKSVEYPDFYVCQNQTFKGTLVGLGQGLLMVNKERKKLLLPHSSVSLASGVFYQTVTISLEDLRQPPCFAYDFDNELKKLKAPNSKSAWLYLAALHAVTSSTLPDPFTEVTGTEMAVRILQSACVYSCFPYGKESTTTLQFIKQLSPKRNYYGYAAPKKNRAEDTGSMEIPNWPKGLPSMAAYDGFAIIVDKLLAESEKLSMLHPKAAKQDEEREKCSVRLRIRAYSRYLTMYNSAVAVQSPNYVTDSQLSLLNGNLAAVVQEFSLRRSSQETNLSNLQTMALARLTNTIAPLLERGIFQKENLSKFLLTKEPLDVPYPGISLDDQGAFDDLLHLDFRSNWLRLYNMALVCNSKEDIDLYSVILSAMAYRGAPIQQVANLHCISLFKTDFPPVSTLSEGTILQGYANPASHCYEISNIESILSNNVKPFTALTLPSAPCKPSRYSRYSYQSVTDDEFEVLEQKYKQDYDKYKEDLREYETQKKAYETQLSTSVWELSRHFEKTYWPSQNIPSKVVSPLLESRNIHARAILEINEMMAFWYQNYKLKLFIDNVQQNLAKLFDLFRANASLERPAVNVSAKQLSEITSLCFVENQNMPIEIGDDLVNTSISQEWACDATKIFETGGFQHTMNVSTEGILLENQSECCKKITQLFTDIRRMLTSGNISRNILYMAGLSPRLDPTSILNYLMRYISGNGEKAKIISNYAGALGVLWTHLKRINRCIRALRAGNTADIQREMQNPGHQTWSPKEYPEWLLLELELDIMIRPVQVDVAKQMMSMPNGGNGVTQLNMGEGKSSVIVPMLCCVLAKKKKQLCRVTVLSSMFKMNLNSLTFSIGGLVNRRVYSIPCRRDMEIDEMCIARIDQVYKECLNMQGIVLTLPEYRLSFRLLAYDKILKKEGNLGQRMLGIENFLRKYARDVLDESDELFEVKYQLVYTIGEHVDLDGGDIRWSVCQRILEIVQKMGSSLLAKYTSSMVEFDENSNAEFPHEFSTFRLLKTTRDFIGEFYETIADKILEEVMISNSEKKAVKQFLTQTEIDWESHNEVVNVIFKDSPDVLNKILLVSGYLRRGVLVLALVKRWRVEHGVNPKQGFRRMAVPFRAKDVAAEKTEFGHPDLAIVLTHLSYYYSGLDDGQLNEVLEILRGKQAPDAIYSSWLAEIPDKRKPDFLHKYYSLNMKDAYQKAQLFKMLRRHKMVVDFWLSHCVFPRESKQFPGKLVMTAWDLCYERQQFPVTGFSGTNGSRILLPLMISQQDLPELESTNLKMEETLLLPENRNHKGFQMGVSCREILTTMMKDKLTVLIDAGALMLECSNEQVADLWLEVDANIEAAVYFSKDNELMVKCRGDHGPGTPFDVSPYQGRLEKCGVFLDDQHTRGTDLKFPMGSKACVTIATRMKRDKLIQACMRMRKLGQGHSVTFYLSHEARDNVLDGNFHENGEITTKAVLQWVTKNTNESNIDGLLYWALAARNYAQRLAAEDNFHYPYDPLPFKVKVEDPKYKSKAEILANQCVDDEVVKLRDMYGQHMQTQLLSKLIPQWFAFTEKKLKMKNNGLPLYDQVSSRFNEICMAVQKKCAKNAPNKTHQVSSSAAGIMEEEQEKELELEKEVEVEEEREVERPRRATEAKHYLHPYVRSVVVDGAEVCVGQSGGSILRLCDVFKSTSFWSQVQPQCWNSCGVYVTNDFISVIREASLYHKTDSYLRPVQYMISTTTEEPSTSSVRLLLLSPYEVNELMPYFRSGQVQCKLHMFSLRRTEMQDILLNNIRLQLPISAAGGSSRLIGEDSQALAALFLASGNLYFASNKEQKAFAQFLGLVPQPWSPREREMFEKKMITKSGFSLPEYRRFLSILEQRGYGFDKDPVMLVKIILLCRHSIISEVTHVMRLLEKKKYIDLVISY